MQILVFFRSWSYFFCFIFVLVQYVSFWHQMWNWRKYVDHMCTEMCPWLLLAIFRFFLCIKDLITVIWCPCHEKIYLILGLPKFASCHTPFGHFLHCLRWKKTLECFFHRPEAFLIWAVTAHLYLRRIFSHTKKGSVLIDVQCPLIKLKRPTIWLKLTNARNDRK